MIRKLRAKMMPPPGTPRPGARHAAHAGRDAGVGRRRGGRRQSESRLPDVPAAEPRRVRARGSRPARAGRQRRRLPAARHDERQLRQHRRRADPVADAAGWLPESGRRHQPAGGGQCRAPSASETTYTKSRTYSQWDWVDGAPYGTRGGMSVVHNFPADGKYVFKMAFQHTTTGGLSGSTTRDEQIEISINGEPVAVLNMDQWLNTSDPNGVNLEIEKPMFVRPVPQRVSAVFVRQSDGPVEDLLAPHEWSMVDTEIGDGLRDHRAAAHEGAGRRRSVQRHRCLGDAEPPEDFHLPPGVARRGAAMRREDHRPARGRGVSPPARRDRYARPSDVLRCRRQGRRVRGRRQDGAAGDAGEPGFRLPR